MQEVKQELAQLQKDYSVEVLRKQNNEQIRALQRSLEWFKDECKKFKAMINKVGLKLSNDVKNKARIIENLRFKNEELMSYKKGYEVGIKDVKSDMLVLRFINKVKTKLLRKYTKRLKQNGKFIDCTDLRKPIQKFLNRRNIELGGPHTENLYLKNQMRTLAYSDQTINTAELIYFFLRIIEQKEAEKIKECKKLKDKVKYYKNKHNLLSRHMEKYRNTMTHLPKLMYKIVLDTMHENQAQSLENEEFNIAGLEKNYKPSAQHPSLENSTEEDRRNPLNLPLGVQGAFRTEELEILKDSIDRKARAANSAGIRKPAQGSSKDLIQSSANRGSEATLGIHDKVLRWPEQHRMKVIQNLIRNNVFMAAVAEVISQNDFYSYKRSFSQRTQRTYNSTAQDTIRNSHMYNKSRIKHQQYLASISFKERSQRQARIMQSAYAEDSLDQAILPKNKADKAGSGEIGVYGAQADEIDEGAISAGEEMQRKEEMNLLRRRRVFKYLLKSRHGRDMHKGRRHVGPNFNKKGKSKSFLK